MASLVELTARARSWLAPPRGFHAWRDSRSIISRHQIITVALFGVVITLLAAVAVSGLEVLSSVRAYIAGESFWSKAQKEAIYSLYRYSHTHDEKDYENFQRALAIPLADHQARLELEKPSPDYNISDDAFRRGGNHPDDVRRMAALYRRFRHVSYIDKAISIWAEADKLLERLRRRGQSIHAEVTSANPSQPRIDQLMSEAEEINRELPKLENAFSDTLGDAARWAKNLLTNIIIIGAIILSGLGLLLSYRFLLQVHAADERYRYLIDTANDAILISDAHTEEILVANRKAEELIGIPAIDITGKPQSEFLIETPADSNTHSAPDICVLSISGARTPVEISASRVDIGGRNVIQSILRDVSERRRLESELRQASKMEAIGKLAGGIAHDFNNLLTIIGGYGQLLLSDPAVPESAQNALQQIEKAADRAASLTRQLLAFGRRQVLQPRLLDLNAVLKSLEDMLRRLIRTDIDLVVDLAEGLGSVKADPVQIEQVLLNLVTNARDAMPTGGFLRISTENIHVEEIRYASSESPAPGDYVVLSVYDTGVGMDAETKARVFEPFFTTKEMGRGTGLGLSTIYGIVQQSGGYVTVDSEPGVGTTFQIYLPRVDANPAPVRPRNHNLPPKGTESILLAEDQADLRILLRQVLERQGYHVCEAGNGRQAMALYEQNNGKFDLVVTDIVMPEMGGLELGELLRRKSSELSLLFISGYTTIVSAQGALPPGAEFLPKPFAPDVLARRVGQILQKRPARQKLLRKDPA